MSREKNPTSPTSRKSAPRRKTPSKTTAGNARFVGLEQRAALISEAAYFRAERRSFEPGHEIEDWLAAEAEVDARLLQSASGSDVQPPS